MAEVPLIVIDNSVVVKWHLQEDFADQQAIEDALYLTLAQIEDCRVITHDRKFYNSMPANRLLWLPDYQSPTLQGRAHPS